MMILSPRNEKKRTRRLLIIATGVVVLALAFDWVSGGTLRGLVRFMSTVAWSSSSRMLSSVAGSGLFSNVRALHAENEALKQEISRLQVQTASYESLAEENTALREIVHLAEGSAGLTAPIVSSTRSSPYGTFMVGAGSAEGVVEGNIVVVGERGSGIVIGEVDDVHEHVSLVTEVFAPGTSIEGSLRGIPTTFEGQGGGNARTKISQELEVEVGDTVTSPAFGGRLVGVVGAIASDPTNAYQSVYIRTPVNLSELRFVYVIP